MSFGRFATQLAKLEALTKPHYPDAVVRNARRNPATEQVATLTEALLTMDEAQRQAVYATLTDAELEGLCGSDMCAYLATLPDTTIQALVDDHSGRAPQKALRAYRRWRQYHAPG